MEQLKGSVNAGVADLVSVGGMQVAEVNWSTSLRTKKRGKVPPRLQTLLGKS